MYPVDTAVSVGWIRPWNVDKYGIIYGKFFNSGWQNDFQNNEWWALVFMKQILYAIGVGTSARVKKLFD